jgi:hypothetical protein
MIKSLNIALPEELHYRVKQKCQFYELTLQEVVAALLEKFDEGELDYIFKITP